MGRNVSEVLLEILADAGVRHIFGIPGDAINGLVEAIRLQDTIRFVQVRHEEAGAFAASAQAKLTGELAVCVGTAGPGAIHLLNGLYDAKMDHAPVLAITGQIETEFIGTDYHQEVDLDSLFDDVAAFNETIMNPGQMPRIAVQACQTALSGPGVSHLSIPIDLADRTVDAPDDRHPVFRPDAVVTPDEQHLEEAAALLNGAARVAILAGVGCRGAGRELCDVAERLGAPIIRSLRAKDVIPDEHPHSVGGLGLLGTRPAVDAIEGCDALLMVGTDFPYPDFYPAGTPAVQIDLVAARLGKRYPVQVGLVGHARPTLARLLERLDGAGDRSFLKRSQAGMRRWRQHMEEDETSDDSPIRPQRLARAIGDLAADDAIFTCDTGAVTVWGARNLRLREGQLYTLSASLASMAFAMPAAIGAQLRYPGRQVVSLSGDGGLGMLMGDFLTAVKYELPITVVVFNNGKLGLIQMEQEVQGYPEFQTHLHNPDFALVAQACGGRGVRVEEPGDLEGALREALSAGEPWIVDVRINPEERTMPPKIFPRQAVGYSMAKMRELFGAGDKEGGLEVLSPEPDASDEDR